MRSSVLVHRCRRPASGVALSAATTFSLPAASAGRACVASGNGCGRGAVLALAAFVFAEFVETFRLEILRQCHVKAGRYHERSLQNHDVMHTESRAAS